MNHVSNQIQVIRMIFYNFKSDNVRFNERKLTINGVNCIIWTGQLENSTGILNKGDKNTDLKNTTWNSLM